MKKFDVMVIGAGSAGRYGAKLAASAGAQVGLVENGPFGGLCILNGCMPTKAYLRSSDLVGMINKGPELGVYMQGPIQLHFDQIKKRKDRLIAEMAEDAELGTKAYTNITLLSGAASFVSKDTLQVGEARYHCEKFLIATGSRVSVPPFPGLKEAGFLTSDDALALEKLPASMIVIGGGAEALEFGQFFHRMGVKTSVVQRSALLLSGEDADVGRAFGALFRKEGMALWTGTQIEQIEMVGSLKRVHFQHEGKSESIDGEEILLVTGRKGEVSDLGLDRAAVEYDTSGIKVNDFLQTSNPNIYAAGDVTGLNLVVNVATYQGKIAGENLLNGPVKKADYRVIPIAIFTDPQFARVGLTEKEAKERAIPVRVGRFPFEDLGKAIVTDQTEGFIKILAAPESGEILGAQIFGAEASDLIHQAAIAMHFRCTLEEYAKISHIHPTFGEIMLYLVEDMIGAV